MRILGVGGGGREAAIAWQLARTDTVLCAAGHAQERVSNGDKRFALELMRDILPQYTPRFWVVASLSALDSVFADVASAAIDIVVKPQGLTAGKGVKVMGPHQAREPLGSRDTCRRRKSGQRHASGIGHTTFAAAQEDQR